MCKGFTFKDIFPNFNEFKTLIIADQINLSKYITGLTQEQYFLNIYNRLRIDNRIILQAFSLV